jgi:hypothetical protein
VFFLVHLLARVAENFLERRYGEVRRIPLLRTRVTMEVRSLEYGAPSSHSRRSPRSSPARPTRACDQVHANIMPHVTEARRCAMTLLDPSTR